MKNWEIMSSLSSKDLWVTPDLHATTPATLHICSISTNCPSTLSAPLEYSPFFLCPFFLSALFPQMEWALSSSPQTLQDGNLVLYCSVGSGGLLQANLSSARGTRSQKRYFQGCPLTVYVGAQRLTLGLWSHKIAL